MLRETLVQDMMKIHELHYAKTNTYLIEGDLGKLLFDTGWSGTFSAFCKEMKAIRIPVQDIDYLLISHFHPDHMGIAQEIAEEGAVILIPEVQKNAIHSADSIFAKEAGSTFVPIIDEETRVFPVAQGRDILKEIGIDGQILSTPGHSDDSISLLLDDGSLFVGDLNPLYELELHKGSQIEDSWNKLLALNPKTVYYGHAKKAQIGHAKPEPETNKNAYQLVLEIMKLIDKGFDINRIQKKTGVDKNFIEDVMRMYLTHRNVGVQGILDRIEIKNK